MHRAPLRASDPPLATHRSSRATLRPFPATYRPFPATRRASVVHHRPFLAMHHVSVAHRRPKRATLPLVWTTPRESRARALSLSARRGALAAVRFFDRSARLSYLEVVVGLVRQPQ
jgi:hypothetical protein